MAEYRKIAAVADIEAGHAGIYEVEGQSIAIWNLNGNFYAYRNVCCHRGGPVGEGDVEGTTVTCPWHGWTYDLTTGACLVRPGSSLRRYELKVENGAILIALR